jgi:hypothetical protein
METRDGPGAGLDALGVLGLGILGLQKTNEYMHVISSRFQTGRSKYCQFSKH